MRVQQMLAWALASSCLVAPPARAAEQIPPALAAKRAGVASQATPAPLNMIYTPIKPCRVFAKRINADVPSHFQVTGSGNLTDQGGPAAGCGVPAYAKAAAITYSTLKPVISGSLTAYAKGASRPGVASARFNKGLSETTGGVVDLNSLGQMSIYPSEAVSVLGDVTGYYEPQLWGYIGSSGSIIDQSGRILSVTKSGTGKYAITFDRDITNCSGTASSDLAGRIESVYTTGTDASVSVYDAAGAAADYWINLHVQC